MGPSPWCRVYEQGFFLSLFRLFAVVGLGRNEGRNEVVSFMMHEFFVLGMRRVLSNLGNRLLFLPGRGLSVALRCCESYAPHGLSTFINGFSSFTRVVLFSFGGV